MIDCSNCFAPCCRHVIPELAIEGSTICRFLDQNTNRCTIYGKRPWICDTDYMYEHYYSKSMSRDEFDRLNSEACKSLCSNYCGNNERKETLANGRPNSNKGSDKQD